MSPPGKNNGRTTYPSVVNAMRPPGISNTALSCRPGPAEQDSGDRSRRLEPSVLVVRRTGAFRRDHRRAERRVRRAPRSESRTLQRLQKPLEHEAARALRRLARGDLREPELPACVVSRERGTERKTTRRDRADASPLPNDHLEDLPDHCLRGGVAGGADDPPVLVL